MRELALRDLTVSEQAFGSSMSFIVILCEWTGSEWIGFVKTDSEWISMIYHWICQ